MVRVVLLSVVLCAMSAGFFHVPVLSMLALGQLPSEDGCIWLQVRQ
jgi:hypothetical protein